MRSRCPCGAGRGGRREVAVHSRPEQVDAEPGAWTRHAEGVLSLALPAPSEPQPPAGPDGDGSVAEVSLPEEHAERAASFVVHPALLDMALAPVLEEAGEPDSVALPAIWRQVSVAGAGAVSLRLRARPSEDGEGVSLTAHDGAGAPVLSAGSVAVRQFDRSAFGRDSRRLYRVEWRAGVVAGGEGGAGPFARLGEGEVAALEGEAYDGIGALRAALDADSEAPTIAAADLSARIGAESGPAAAIEAAGAALSLAQQWVSTEALSGSRLACVTRGAVTAREGDAVDPAAAAVWGLLRCAQAEHPGVFGLIDTDGSEASRRALPRALPLLAEEPQLAIREGTVLAPRLGPAPVSGSEAGAGPRLDPDATALVFGDLDGAGAIAARHLAAVHGCRRLLLAGADGEERPAAELKTELERAGAEVRLATCDPTDSGQLRGSLRSVPSEHPLGVVVHSLAAGEHGILVSSDRERLERAMRAKVESAWILHESTKDLDLARFVLFSSAAGLLGGAGQSCSAAANAFVDALAARRRADGLVATSVAWGLWTGSEVEAGTGREAASALEQVRTRLGFAPMATEPALEALDLACASSEPSLALIELDRAALRRRAKAGALPRILSGLIPAGARRENPNGVMASRLAEAAPSEREGILLDLVRSHAAAVLGHDSPADIEPGRAFRDLGFDSVSAVELGNRIGAATGLRLPPAVAFDHPSVVALAKHLLERMEGASSAAVRPRRATADDEPIAIVGMSCRYPGGADSPDELWRVLEEGIDAIGELPTDRGWELPGMLGLDGDGAPPGGTGGFLEGVTEFDPAFFGIAPREAVSIDPQQRLMLESAWQAFEDAGIDPDELRESDTGVFAGASAGDYAFMLASREPSALGSIVSGNSTSVVAGRLSYAFGLHGPAVAVDTACSSSLVALHLACNALRAGECSLALAGGAFVITNPAGFLDLADGLSGDGRCKAFDESADGTGFSEGVGVVLVERLSEAERRGHRVLAQIRGSAVNQDGASNGLIAPNGPAQERVIRQALANAGLEPGDVDAVEAHGTGTALGDPIEAGALLATYGQDRDRALWLGSLKSNIGHTAAAAGVGGVIKLILAMREEVLPKTLHVRHPSSRVDWSAGRVELLTGPIAWPRNGRPRRAAVSSFGMSGTNAHLVLEEPPAAGGREDGDGDSPQALSGVLPLVLSARTEAALTESAARLREKLNEERLELADVGLSLVTTRTSFERRAVVLGESEPGLRAGLVALTRGADDPHVVRGTARPLQRCAFLYPGVGGQWEGMAVRMRDASPDFSRALDECVEALEPHLEWSLGDALRSTDPAAAPARPDVGWVSLFATMVALTAAWRSCGVSPSVVAGHSQGEVLAAHVAGGLSLEDAARVVAVRTEGLLELVGKGAMASVSLDMDGLEPLLEPWRGQLDVAALNGPSATVVSGELEALEALLERCAARGVEARRIPGAVAASHSSQVERLRERLLAGLAGISPRSGEIPFHSTVTGTVLDTAELGPEYWYENMRRTVRLEPVVRGLVGEGCGAFVEVSPHPVLIPAVQATAEQASGRSGAARAIGSLRRDDGGPERFARSLAEAHVAGLDVDWRACFGSGAEVVKLPTYPFQRRRYWPDGEVSVGAGDIVAAGAEAAGHPLLGAAVEGPGGEWIFTGRLSLSTQAWLADRTVLGVASLPPAALLEIGLAVASRLGAEGVAEMTVREPLELTGDAAAELRVSVRGEEGGGRRFEIHSRRIPAGTAGGAAWTMHAAGRLGAAGAEEPGAERTLDNAGAWPPAEAEALDPEALYDELERLGFHHGPASRAVRRLWRHGSSLFAELALAEDKSSPAAGYRVHPALLDCAAQIAICHGGELWGDGCVPSQPLAWQGVRAYASGQAALRLRIDPTRGGIRLSACGADGVAAFDVEAALPQPIEPAQLEAARQRRWLHRLAWRRVSEPRPVAAQPLVAVLGEAGIAGIDAVRHSDIAALTKSCGGGEVPDLVVADPGSQGEPGDVAASARRACRRALELLQAWVGAEPLQGARLVVLTEGAVAATEGESPDLATAPLWGMLRSAHSEHPGRFAVVDLDGSEASREALPAALALTAAEPQLALRAGRPLSPRLTPARFEPERGRGPGIDPETTVLVSGGLSGIGAAVARHLAAEHGVRHLLLLSRRGPQAPNAAEVERELREFGAEPTVVACDVADRNRLREVLDSIPAEHPLGAVIHSAAVLDNGVLESLDGERLDVVMRPKVERRLEPARADPWPGPLPVRPLRLGRRRARQRGSGQLLGGERVPRRSRSPPPSRGTAGRLHRLGRLGARNRADRRGRRSRLRPRRRCPGEAAGGRADERRARPRAVRHGARRRRGAAGGGRLRRGGAARAGRDGHPRADAEGGRPRGGGGRAPGAGLAAGAARGRAGERATARSHRTRSRADRRGARL